MIDKMKVGLLGAQQEDAGLVDVACKHFSKLSVLGLNGRDIPLPENVRHCPGDARYYDDVLSFGRDLDAINVGSQHVNTRALRELELMGTRIYPSAATIEMIRNVTEIAQQVFERNPGVISDAPVSSERMQLIVSRNDGGVVEVYQPYLMSYYAGKMFVPLKGTFSERKKILSICNLAIVIAEKIALNGLIWIDLSVLSNEELFIHAIDLRCDQQRKCYHVSPSHTVNEIFTKKWCTPVKAPGFSQIEYSSFQKYVAIETIKTIMFTSDIHIHFTNLDRLRTAKAYTGDYANSSSLLLDKSVAMETLLMTSKRQ